MCNDGYEPSWEEQHPSEEGLTPTPMLDREEDVKVCERRARAKETVKEVSSRVLKAQPYPPNGDTVQVSGAKMVLLFFRHL